MAGRAVWGRLFPETLVMPEPSTRGRRSVQGSVLGTVVDGPSSGILGGVNRVRP